MKRRVTVLVSVATLALFLLVSLVMMSDATQNSARFGRLYFTLLVFNGLGLVTFVVLIGVNIHRLVRQLRRRAPGSRLTLRMVALFTALAVAPVLVVYGFSLNFLSRGIDSWFDVRIDKAMNDSLELSRSALDLRMRELLKQTDQMAQELSEVTDAVATLTLDDLRSRSGASELSLLTDKGGIIASSSTFADLVPNLPSETILLQLRQGRSYIGLDPIRNSGLFVRVVVNVPDLRDISNIEGRSRLLQGLFPIPDRMNELADDVQSAFVKYTELSYLRDQLKISFTMTLTLVLLFGIFGAVWTAFYSARALAAPIRDLAIGTEAVARGDYSTQLPVPSNDEMGILVESFNDMTRKLAMARDEARQSRDEVDAQRAYLEAVLGRLSSGVMALDTERRLRTANATAGQILGVALESLMGDSLEKIAAKHPQLGPFCQGIEHHLEGAAADWREQVVLFGASGRQVLMCRGTSLAESLPHQAAGHVIVFDDITALIQGQRDAAWGEVARRLAHEIKNPLTPIQLSAERLRHKYLSTMAPKDSEVLDRLTHTIVQQVETMKDMVNTFSEYARSPQMQARQIDLNRLVEEVLDLYRNVDTQTAIEVQLGEDMPHIEADPGRLRQVLNNLVKNALEANEGRGPAVLKVSTRGVQDANLCFVELRIEDRGPGIPGELFDRIFEPYVTSKPKGTGLGLAIVKKIIEEHGGMVWMENNAEGGASAVIRLPVSARGRDAEAPPDAQRSAV